MLYGTYEHGIDSKKRIFMPAKFREEMGKEYVYRIFKAGYPTIQLFRREDFEAMAVKDIPGGPMSVQGRRALMKCYIGVDVVTCDTQGRIVLNKTIADEAGLVKDCMIVGFGSYVEIMSAESYSIALGDAADRITEEDESYRKEEKLINDLRAQGAYIDMGNMTAKGSEVS